MIKAAFITQHEDWPWQRQLPAGSSIFQGVAFFSSVDAADIIFVYDALPTRKLMIPKGKITVFICSEPENVKRYLPNFLKQFNYIVTTDRNVDHPNPIFIQAGLPWHFGSMSDGNKYPEHPLNYEDLKSYKSKNKKKLASVVSSDKDFTEEHRARLRFVSLLKEEFGDQIDVFGRGIESFVDKRDVLEDYRYHIALENCMIEDYWTEKIADPFLSLTYPIYHGCPNLSDYYSPKSFTQINIYEPEKAIETIKRVLESDLDQLSYDELLKARNLTMGKHNLFGLLSYMSQKIMNLEKPLMSTRDYRIFPEHHFLTFAVKVRYRILDTVTNYSFLHKNLKFSRRVYKSILSRCVVGKRKTYHHWRYWTDQFYRAHQNYIKDNPREKKRYDYALPNGAMILDAGGYDVDFVQECLDRFNAEVHVFEPVIAFAENIKRRFTNETSVQIYVAGLSDKDEHVDFHLGGDASGLWNNEGGSVECVHLWNVERFLNESNVKSWDLIKLNIEGGEYAVLKKLIDSGLISKFKHIQVQFHLNVPNAKKEYKMLVKQLRDTHIRQWCYPFVWESWQRKC